MCVCSRNFGIEVRGKRYALQPVFILIVYSHQLSPCARSRIELSFIRMIMFTCSNFFLAKQVLLLYTSGFVLSLYSSEYASESLD